jgi:hypothetical protein
MLCTMCMHGVSTDKLWICRCPDSHCWHVRECPQCGTKRRALTELGFPDGHPDDVAAWKAQRTPVAGRGNKPPWVPRPKRRQP